MYRILTGTVVLFALMTMSAAHARPWDNVGNSKWSNHGISVKVQESCKRVQIGFSCRGGRITRAAAPCRAGESEARCCARWRATHSNPHKGLCKGRGTGLTSYKCGCASTGGQGSRPGDPVSEPPGGSPLGILDGPRGPGEPGLPTAPGVPREPRPAPEPPVPAEPQEPTGEPTSPTPLPGGSTGLPGLTQPDEPRPPRPDRFREDRCRYCLRVSTRYFCKSGVSGYKAHGCGKGQSQADCCRKAMASVCGGKNRLDSKKTGKIQGACKCVKWSKWTKCKRSRSR